MGFKLLNPIEFESNNMAVNVNITKKEYAYIDGGSGEELTPEQFNQKYSTVNLGGLTAILSGGKPETAEEENNSK